MPHLTERHAAEMARVAVQELLANGQVQDILAELTALFATVGDVVNDVRRLPVSLKLVNIPFIGSLEIQVSICQQENIDGQ